MVTFANESRLDEWSSFLRRTMEPDRCIECGGYGEIIAGDGGNGIGGSYSETGCTTECNRCHGTGLAVPPGPFCSARLP